MEANLLAVAGIAYDIVGVVLLAKAIMFVKDDVLSAQAGSCWGGNVALYVALVRQQHDGKFGLGVIVLGFVGQLLAALRFELPLLYWPMFAAALLLILTWYTVAGRQLNKFADARYRAHFTEREARAAKGE